MSYKWLYLLETMYIKVAIWPTAVIYVLYLGIGQS